MNRYEKYKDSGIAWIGEIPEGWSVRRIKFCVQKSFAGVWGDDAKSDDNDVRCYRVADFDYEKRILSNKNPTNRNIDNLTFQNRKVNYGDILLEKSGGGDKTPVGRAVIVNYDIKAICSNFVHCIKPDSDTNSKFLQYVFNYMYSKKINGLYYSQTTGIQNLNVSGYLNNPYSYPSLAEQEAIAEFLDGKCEEVDRLVGLQQAMIEELVAYKQSVITECVTKGLDPSAPLRDSGIPWIGSIPAHWDTSTIRYISSVFTGTTPSTSNPEYYNGNDVYWYSPSDFSDSTIHLGLPSKTLSDKSLLDGAVKLFPSNSILLIGIGGTLGRIGHSVYECSSNQQINAIIVKKGYNSVFYAYMLSIMQSYIWNNANTSTMPILNQSATKKLEIAIPPLQEQQAIADHLDRKCEEIDNLITIKREKIEQLKEYKKSIIFEYVTGKKRVMQ